MGSATAMLGVPAKDAGGSRVRKRVASAMVLIPLFLWLVVLAPGWLFQGVVVLVSGLAAWEVLRLFDRGERPVYRTLGALLAAGVTASFAVPSAGVIPAYPVLALALAVAAVVSAPVWSGAPPASEPPAYTLLAVGYVGWLLGFAMLLHALASGPWLLLFMGAVTWAGESAAYVVGSAVGRRKLAPVLSPGKTVEGAAAQLVVSVAVAAGLGPWLLPDCAPAARVVAGAVLGSVGQVGDLAESALKRSAGAKDAGDLIPGHGGVLDRVDSLLFNVPAMYVYAVATGCGR